MCVCSHWIKFFSFSSSLIIFPPLPCLALPAFLLLVISRPTNSGAFCLAAAALAISVADRSRDGKMRMEERKLVGEDLESLFSLYFLYLPGFLFYKVLFPLSFSLVPSISRITNLGY